MESIFRKLRKAGIGRRSLYLAWDFTVASERNLTERALHLRDDAFALLGDTDLADGQIQGDAPDFTVTSVTAVSARASRCSPSSTSTRWPSATTRCTAPPTGPA
jgi:hypothetical protein